MALVSFCLSHQCFFLSPCLVPATHRLLSSILNIELDTFYCWLIVREREKCEHETLRDTKQAFDSNWIMRLGLIIKNNGGEMQNVKWTSERWVSSTFSEPGSCLHCSVQ